MNIKYLDTNLIKLKYFSIFNNTKNYILSRTVNVCISTSTPTVAN